MVTAHTTSPWFSVFIWRAWRGIPGPTKASGGNGTGCICPSAATWKEYALIVQKRPGVGEAWEQTCWEKEEKREQIKMYRKDKRCKNRKCVCFFPYRLFFRAYQLFHRAIHSSNIQGTANTLTVCHLGSLSDWEAFQELSCEDVDQNRPWEEQNKDIMSKHTHTHTYRH